MGIASQNEMIRDRTVMIRQAFWLEYLTLAWMTVEAAVAIASGIAANPLTLVAFGIDSVIELASAGILVWRLTVELRRGQMFAESAEQKGIAHRRRFAVGPCRLCCCKRWLEAVDTPRRRLITTRPYRMRTRSSDNVFPLPP